VPCDVGVSAENHSMEIEAMINRRTLLRAVIFLAPLTVLASACSSVDDGDSSDSSEGKPRFSGMRKHER
ncbi:MAG: hypothetical protein V3S24_23305, partial [Candidatus Tectomicrobia bacterium]